MWSSSMFIFQNLLPELGAAVMHEAILVVYVCAVTTSSNYLLVEVEAPLQWQTLSLEIIEIFHKSIDL